MSVDPEFIEKLQKKLEEKNVPLSYEDLETILITTQEVQRSLLQQACANVDDCQDVEERCHYDVNWTDCWENPKE